MSDLNRNEPEELDAHTRFELMEEGEALAERDQPPEEYKNFHGVQEVDIAHVGHIYNAVVTAHFPNEQSGRAAKAEIEGLGLSRPVQWFVKEAPEVKGDRNDEGLAPGESALIVQLDNEAQGKEVIEICERAGARHSAFYPTQKLGSVPDEA